MNNINSQEAFDKIPLTIESSIMDMMDFNGSYEAAIEHFSKISGWNNAMLFIQSVNPSINTTQYMIADGILKL